LETRVLDILSQEIYVF